MESATPSTKATTVLGRQFHRYLRQSDAGEARLRALRLSAGRQHRRGRQLHRRGPDNCGRVQRLLVHHRPRASDSCQDERIGCAGHGLHPRRDFNPISCGATTIDLNASWTGQGPITRGVTNSHFKSGGFSVNTHFNGADRNATAAGTIAGVSFGAADVEFADLGTTNSGVTTVCRSTSC